jgi:hypothetical protein
VREISGLEAALTQALAMLGAFQPRRWVLENMTDAVCSRKLYEVIMREAAGAKVRAG